MHSILKMTCLSYPMMMNFFKIMIIFFVNYFFSVLWISFTKKKQEKWKVFFFLISWLKNFFYVLLFLSTSFHCWRTKVLSEIGIYVKIFHFLFFLLLQLQFFLFYYCCLYVSMFWLCFVVSLMGFKDDRQTWSLGWIQLINWGALGSLTFRHGPFNQI